MLSSSPKDFTAARRKFEFQSYKLITSQNLIDFGLGNGSVASIVVDNNGEFKLIQAASLQKTTTTTNVLVPAGSLSPALTFRKEIRLAAPQPKVEPNTVNLATLNLSSHHQTLQQQQQHQQQGQSLHHQLMNPAKFLVHHAGNNVVVGNKMQQQQQQQLQHRHSNIKPACLPIPVEHIKEEAMDEDVFLSPPVANSSSSSSPMRQSCRKRPRLDNNIGGGVFASHHSYPSRLRRACDRHWDSSYTPPPILDPSRPGPGLYARLHQHERTCADFVCEDSTQQQGNDGPPPRINIGTRYQATIPPVSCDRERGKGGPDSDHLLWDPGIIDNCLTDHELDMYLQFACCAAVPGGGRNKEYALHLLHMCNGNIRVSL